MSSKQMKKGSALLIVLGMLSFMVISAVSFSIYMRQSRAPSSYLRRNVAARYLVRAAVAKAIETLEGDFNEDENWTGGNASGAYGASYQYGYNRFYGIYDDPYPGCGPDTQKDGANNGTNNGDYWEHRVFCPFGMIDPDYTVPTLTLEGLAYLPPAIADSVRAVSRYTRTAQWRSLPYEAGRYAFTAVNVSDLFDINKLSAGDARTSASRMSDTGEAFGARISLGSLFLSDPTDPTTIDSSTAQQIDNFIDAKNQSTIPVVSMADYSLLADNSFSPFRKYIGSTSEMFTDAQSDDEILRMGSELFITDSWFPPTNSNNNAAKTIDLEDVKSGGQPFGQGAKLADKEFNAGAVGTSYSYFTRAGFQSECGKVLEKNLGVGMVCLADYLDENTVPASLALPTTEAAPMVTGLGTPQGLMPNVNLSADEFDVTWEVEVPGGDDEPKKIIIHRVGKQIALDSIGDRINMSAVVAYPFKRMAKTSRTQQFSYRAIMKVFLMPQGMTSTRVQTALHPTVEEWRKSNSKGNSGTVEYSSAGVATVYGTVVNAPQFTTDIKTETDALQDIVIRFDQPDIKMPICWVVEQYPEESAYDSMYKRDPVYTLSGLDQNQNQNMQPLQENGAVDSGWWAGEWLSMDQVQSQSTDFQQIQAAALEKQQTYRLCTAVWVQVVDEDQNVVDMVPAYCEDDADWLDYDGAGQEDIKLGEDAPLLYFKGTKDINFTDHNFDQCFDGAQVEFEWGALYAVDPRYNFAPENWYSKASSIDATKETWLSDIHQIMGQNGRDRDIFMFVSDQGYLQSIGELQFLPMLECLDGTANILGGRYSPDFNGTAFSNRTGPDQGDFACKNYFWHTYTAYRNGYRSNATAYSKTDDKYRDPIYSLPYNGVYYTFTCGGSSSFRINPYSQENRIIWAALANTPFDYCVASTNKYAPGPTSKPFTMSDQINNYSFGPNVDVAKLTQDDFLKIADSFIDNFSECAKNGDSDWGEAYDWEDSDVRSGWSGNEGDIGDSQLRFLDEDMSETLHGVDRKFLYSFWRECFANRQQLFLIFVRAEPAAVGGGGSGKNSVSQLGGRAVALVWRDPAPPAYNSSLRNSTYSNKTMRDSQSAQENRNRRQNVPPHRTRILFYHVFD